MRRGTAKAKLYCKLFVDRDWFRNLCRDVEMFRGDGNGHLVWTASSLDSNISLLSAQGLCVVAQAGAGLCRMLLIARMDQRCRSHQPIYASRARAPAGRRKLMIAGYPNRAGAVSFLQRRVPGRVATAKLNLVVHETRTSAVPAPPSSRW